MKEKAKKIFNALKLKYAKLTPKLRKTILISMICIGIFSVGTAVFLNNKPYEPLFSGLNQQEASEIMSKLQDMGVDYKYSDEVIFVPKDQEAKLKAQLVYEGYPKNGFTYDIFKDNVNMMTTDFEKENYKLFELQNRIGSTIRLFNGVSDAKVTIAMSEEQKYVLNSDESQKANASVVVIMSDGGSPTPEQVKGIQRLVSKSIPNMQMEDVAVLDGNGNDVSTINEDTAQGANKVKLEFEKYIDDSVRAKILAVLSPVYGSENVKVSVRTTANVDKKIREIINHETPIESSEKGIPVTESTETEIIRDPDVAGGIPGTETNADIPTYSQIEVDGTESYIRSQSDIDYIVNELKEQAQIDAGTIEDMTVSVIINSKTTGDITERKLKSLIGNAAGISKELQDDKIAVVAVPFYDGSTILPGVSDEQGLNNWIIIGAIISGVLLIILVIILLIVIRRKNKKIGLSNESETLKKHTKASKDANIKEMMQKQQEEKENQILNLTNEKGLELKNKVRDIASENPEISAQLIRNWLKGGE